FTEQTPLAPNSRYSASKASADMLVRAAHMTFDFDTIITRCSNNYGPHQFPEKLIPFMIRRALADETLPVYGDGLQIRDWIHVEDHCRGILLALEQGRPGGVYNFGGDAEMTNIALVRLLLERLDKPESLIRHVQDRPGHDRRYAMDYSLAAGELGYVPQKSFAEGLAATISWYLEHQAWVDDVVSGEYRRFTQKWYAGRE
ncbi:MAG: GDP-mannose 4,6-dehydratase, partial [Deltaproteobacteria bacterium]|nr:GDP-mannose 4,6-dehydratase [Deltaproteobacteria bacterium]